MNKCCNCIHFDMNDIVHCYGTCEIMDEDFPVYHECSCDKNEIKLVEKLIEERKGKCYGTGCQC